MVLYKNDISNELLESLEFLKNLSYDDLIKEIRAHIHVIGRNIYNALILSESIDIKKGNAPKKREKDIKIINAQLIKRHTKNKYQRAARELTRKQPIHLLINSDKPKLRDKSQFQSYDFYVIDHKIAVSFGYKNNISIEDISHISNLRWIPSKENAIKAQKNFIDEDNKWILDKYHIKIK